MDKDNKKIIVKSTKKDISQGLLKESMSKDIKEEPRRAAIMEDDPLYCLYLDTVEYKSLLDKKEYIIDENGRVLLGKYRNKQLAIINTFKYVNRGLLVSLVVI